MKLKRIVASVSVALALGVAATAAQAGTISGGVYTAGDYNLGLISSGDTGFTSLLPLDGAASFSDKFTFSLGSATGGIVGITSIFYPIGFGPAPDIKLSLDGQAAVSATLEVTGAAANVKTAAYTYTFSNILSNTSHYLTVSGSNSNALGSSYTFKVTPVPEPESYAMLLAGLGLMVSVARRRRAPRP